jgi:fatty acid desaturase
MSRSSPFFRYSPYDAIPALCVVAIVALIFWTFLAYRALPWLILAPAFLALTYSYLWNLQCLSHNFIHNPFFRWPWLNRAFSVLETFAIGVPHVFYHHYHLNHHAGDNDRKGPNGTTRDWSSIYRHSKDDEPEPFWRYVLVGFWRVEMGPLLRVVWRHGWPEVCQAAVETVVLVGFLAMMAWVDWRYFVVFYLPSYYLGWMLSYAEGYLEHYGAEPGDPLANSVSSYHRVYNLLWFNNGYHQEHHWDPKHHWTRMRQLHEQIKPELIRHGTRTLKGPHLTALIEDWLAGRKQQHPAEMPPRQMSAA